MLILKEGRGQIGKWVQKETKPGRINNSWQGKHSLKSKWKNHLTEDGNE